MFGLFVSIYLQFLVPYTGSVYLCLFHRTHLMHTQHLRCRPVDAGLWRRYRDGLFHREDDPERPVLQVRGRVVIAVRENSHRLDPPHSIDRNPHTRV